MGSFNDQLDLALQWSNLNRELAELKKSSNVKYVNGEPQLYYSEQVKQDIALLEKMIEDLESQNPSLFETIKNIRSNY